MNAVLGPDISSFQHGLDLAACGSAAFVIAKTTEGTYYTDADYQGWRQQAKALGRLFVWYHFLSGEDPHAQAAHTAANVGDTALPGMLDFEPTATFRPSLAQALAYVDAAHGAGLKLALVYLPRWYWQQIGSPDLTPFADRGLRLVSSSYPGGSGPPAQLYPGDSAAGWGSYGGMTPLIYQFTDQASDGGQQLDYNAYRGTVAQLATLLGTASTPPSGGTGMGTIPPSIAHAFAGLDLTSEFQPNATFDNDNALIWADAGARAAAHYGKQILDVVNTMAAPQPVDVVALAAALAPHIAVTTDVGQLAADLIPHLPGGVDLQALADAIVAATGAKLSAP